jgi:AraC-like DNA-binding protein
MLTGWYSPVDPPTALASLLVCSWTARPSGLHRLVPDGCIDILWVSDGSTWLCGPETTAWTFALPDNTSAVGVRFRPGAASSVLDLETSSIVNQRVPLGDYIGVKVAASISRTLAATRTPDDLALTLRAFEAHLVDLWGDRSTDPMAEAIIQQLTRSPRATQGELAVTLGVTARHLHRRALTLFGYGTSTLARLLRFQRCLALATTAVTRNPPTTLARLAIDAGYSDHAHLVRDCRAITGETPREFLSSYFPTFPDMSDPYKTRAKFAVSMAQ